MQTSIEVDIMSLTQTFKALLNPRDSVDLDRRRSLLVTRGAAGGARVVRSHGKTEDAQMEP